MLLFVISILLSSFLLFLIQPMIGKALLPWFGGGTGVWSASLVFFQVILTGGYAYCYWLMRRRMMERQGRIHLGALIISLLVMGWHTIQCGSPVLVTDSCRPIMSADPFIGVLVLLSVSVGVPFFLLSTNSTLLQTWFKYTYPDRSPYWLYALSNLGSLVGLLAYPVVVEPNLPLLRQSIYWSVAYVIFVLVTVSHSFQMMRKGSVVGMEFQAANAVETRPHRRDYGLWTGLSALASIFLLSTTSRITQEVAAIPLLWILPLSLYLFAFIIAFSGEKLYARWFFFTLLTLGSGAYLWFIVASRIGYLHQLVIYLVLLFSVTMLCLGELYRRRPDPRYLTDFYLWVSIGGALGGLTVNLIIPLLFKNYWEFQVSLGIVWVLVFVYLMRYRLPVRYFIYRGLTIISAIGACLVFGSLYIQVNTFKEDAIWSTRNFYGALSIKERYPDDEENHNYTLTHGVTIHGYQFTQSEKRLLPTAYYVEDSGVGVAFRFHPKRPGPMKVGMIGLGVGVLAAYGEKGDTFVFYEINPAVIEIANHAPFSYLEDSLATIEIVLGDGRKSLEEEYKQGGSNQYDLIVVDAFNSDSIPTHLLNLEAIQLYQKHLTVDGILAFHISNQYVDLRPVVVEQAEAIGIDSMEILYQSDDIRTKASRWILLTQSQEFQSNPQVIQRRIPDTRDWDPITLWTDDYSNVFQTLR